MLELGRGMTLRASVISSRIVTFFTATDSPVASTLQQQTKPYAPFPRSRSNTYLSGSSNTARAQVESSHIQSATRGESVAKQDEGAGQTPRQCLAVEGLARP